MGRPRKQAREPFWFADRKAWYVTVGTTKMRLSPDKAEAWRLWHEMMARGPDEAGAPAKAGSPDVAGLLVKFLAWCEKNRAARTYDAYRTHLRAFSRSIPSGLDVAGLKPYHVTAVVDSREWSNNTKHDFIVTVKRALNWCVEQGLIDRSPVASMQAPAVEARETASTPAEYALAMEAIVNPAFRRLFEMGWETGARLQELRVVEAAHVDLENRRIVLPRARSKGKKHMRVVYLGTDRAVELTAELCRSRPTGPILLNTQGRPWNKCSVKCAFTKLNLRIAELMMERAGNARPTVAKVPKKDLSRARAERRAALKLWYAERDRIAKHETPAMHFGSLRKGYATEALKAGVDTVTVGALLGHRDGVMVSRVYGRVQQSPEHMAEMARRAKTPRPKSRDA